MSELGASVTELTKAEVDGVLAKFSDSEKGTIATFLTECYNIKYRMRYYLIFTYQTHGQRTSWSIDEKRYYELLDDRKAFEEALERYNRVSLDGEVKVYKATIRHMEIDKTYHCYGLPRSAREYGVKAATKEELGMLLGIQPKPEFEPYLSYELKKSNYDHHNVSVFYAPEDEMKGLFRCIKLSMTKANHVIYLNTHIILEAGRGTKWYVKTIPESNVKQVRDLIIRNCPGASLEAGYSFDKNELDDESDE
jgi:hypothetical protein